MSSVGKTLPNADTVYRRRRFELLCRACDSHVPYCQHCGKVLHLDVDKLHFHHVNEDEGHESGIGGKQHLYLVENDLENGVEIEVRCFACHLWEHNRQTSLWNPKLPEGVA